MYIYFSTNTTREMTGEALLQTKANNLLFSQEYKSSLKQWIELISKLDKPNIMIDSGAFSAWTGGLKIDREKYLEFIIYIKKIFSPYAKNLYFVNLDVIPGEFGRKPDKMEIEESAKKGLENYFWFRSKGVETIHVFHQHEEYDWLYKIAKESEYIGISPANDLLTKQRMPFLKNVFSIIKANNKTHCFGGTDRKILFECPFYSADSSAFLSCKHYGFSFGNKRVEKHIKNREILEILLKKQKEKIVEKQHLEQEATLLWKQRGVIFTN